MTGLSITASGGIRKGPRGRIERWFRGAWVPEANLTPEELREATTPPSSPTSGEPVRRKGTPRPPEPKPKAEPKADPLAKSGPTFLQAEAWETVERLGTQVAACKELGLDQSGLQSRLKGYQKAMGLTGPLPGYQPKTKAGGTSRRFDAPPPKVKFGEPPRPRATEPVADAAHDVSTERQADADLAIKLRLPPSVRTSRPQEPATDALEPRSGHSNGETAWDAVEGVREALSARADEAPAPEPRAHSMEWISGASPMAMYGFRVGVMYAALHAIATETTAGVFGATEMARWALEEVTGS